MYTVSTHIDDQIIHLLCISSQVHSSALFLELYFYEASYVIIITLDPHASFFGTIYTLGP